MSNNILVLGGSGFIGNQVVYELAAHGHQVTVVDRKINYWNAPGTIIESDFLDYLQTNNTKFDTVIHFAAEHLVEQSVTEPAKYYTNNVVKMKCLLDHMVVTGIKNIIFSSSGAVYGRQGKSTILSEELYYDPENTYASTKVAGEMLIKDYAKAYGINYVNFRYFNAAGADPECRFGYIQRPATHVIPILCNKILNDEPFTIYGNDYPTVDGTCVRDYVHVADLATAHSRAIDFLNKGSSNETFNLGYGDGGVSINNLVHWASRVIKKDPIIEYKARRAGDSAILIADIQKANKLLNWKPQYNIKDIIQHAWDWECKLGEK